MRSFTTALVLTAVAPSLARAQGEFDATLSIQQGGREIGREQFTFRRPPQGGTTLVAQVRYPPGNTTSQIDASLERAADGSIARFELDVQAPEGNLVILAAGSGARLIIRSVAKGSEAGRELPGGRHVVLLDEGVYSLYGSIAELATPGGARLTGIFPRSGRRATFVARRESGGSGQPTRVQLSGDISGTLATDGEGRLERLELPSLGIVVSRAAK